jgi:hypothetical protein
MSAPKTFKIGIAMAGAVSAGAYTAGVIDYLLETLSKWEGAKERNKQLGEDHPDYDHSVPMHNVVIEVMGGSSAGGMTAAIATLGLFEGLRPINKQNKEKASNKMYEAWVNLNDHGDDKMSTLLQMLTTEDITEHNGVISLLNSQPIDAIAERAKKLSRISDLPDYISSQLEVILTVTSLRGIPLSINFFDQSKHQSGQPLKPAHRMFLHKGIAHLRVTPDGIATDPHVIPFDPTKDADRDLLLQCAKASGAFPLGLAPRELQKTQTSYIRAMVDRMFSTREQDSYEIKAPVNGVQIEVKEDTFDFFAVDGGTVNNEPFGEVIRALEEKCIGEPGQNYAVLMIDPFPNFESETTPERNTSPKLMQLAPKVLGAIRGQAMMKESDLVGGLSDDHTLRMVFPSRKKENGDKDPYPISCGSLDGFGGFFSRGFREHDFKLGRKNCQSFLRNYFCLPLDKAGSDSVFADWNEEDERHKRYFSPDGDGYPIVPDMDFDRRREVNEEIPTPARERIKAKEILQLDNQIQVRLRGVLSNINKYERQEPTQEQQQLEDSVDNILKQHYKPGLFGKLFGRMLNALIGWSWKKFGAKTAARKLTRTVLKTIIMDFKKRGLLE